MTAHKDELEDLISALRVRGGGWEDDLTLEAAERIKQMRDVLIRCREHLTQHHNANGGWWNDPVTRDLISNHIDPALSRR